MGRDAAGLSCCCERMLRLADLLALSFCSQCIRCPVFGGFETINALLLWCFGLDHDFMYLHADIYAKYHHEKCMVLFDEHKYMARCSKGKLQWQIHY